MEWAKEEKELTPDMGHVSHLWAAFPGDEINWRIPRNILQQLENL